jgi:hypothetical protein
VRTGLLRGALLLTLLTGCSGQGTVQDAQAVLRTDVDGLTSAARTGSLASTTAAATALRKDLTRLRASGALPAARAQAIEAQVVRVLADLTPAATAPPRPSPTPSPTAQHEKGKEKADGEGKGKGG